MADKKKIGALITLDGESEFRKAVTSCNKALATMRSESKLVEAQTAGQANTLETLTKKQDVLSRTLSEAVKKEAAVRNGLENSEKQYSSVKNELDSYSKKLKQAKQTLEELEQSESASTDEIEQQRQEFEKLSRTVSQGDETLRKAKDRVNDWKKQLNNAEAQTINATRALNENESLLKEAQDSYDNCATSIDKFGNATDETADKLTSLSTVLKTKVYSGLIDLGKNAISTAVRGTLELDEATSKLEASTGATASEMREYSETMQDTFNEGYGDSVSEIAEAMALVKQYTGEMDSSKLQEMAENALALEDTFTNMDLSETLRGVSGLMTNMGLSAEEAFDYIVVGAQNGLNKSGELTDNISEYSQLWAQAGFSAEEMFTILQNGLDSGAYNLDKVNDFVKEFAISLSDGRIGDNINSFSEDSQVLFEKWKSGGATSKEVFYSIINDLAKMENQQEALTIASNTWSALGEDNAMSVITSLTKLNDTYSDTKGSMESLKSVRYDSITNEYKKLGRTMQSEVITPVLKKFLPVAQSGLKGIADHIDTLVPTVGALGAAFGTVWVNKKAQGFIKDIKEAGKSIITLTTETIAQTTATESATVAQEGLNVAMNSNVIGAVITLVTTLVAGLSTFVALSGDATDSTSVLRSEVNGMVDDLAESQTALQESMDAAKDSVDNASASAQMADGIAEELMSLADATGNTAEKQERMKVLVAELNELYPDMGLEVDSVTGKLNMTNEELKDFIENLQSAAQAQAYQDAFSEAFEAVAEAAKEQIDAEIKLEEAQANRQAAQDELDKTIDSHNKKIEAQAKKEKDLQKHISNGTVTQEMMNDVMSTSNTETAEYNKKLTELTDKLTEAEEIEDQAQSAVDDHKAAVEDATKTAEKYQERYLELTGAVETNTTATQDNAEAQGAQQEAARASISVAGEELTAFQNLSEEQQNLAVNITNTVLAVQTSVQEYLGQSGQLFQEFADTSTISTSTLLSNMESQVEGVKQWEDNMTTLMNDTKTYIDETGKEVQVKLDSGLVQYLMDMGPDGAEYAQTFVSMSGDELAKANELWSEKTNIEGFTNTEGQKLTDGIGTMMAGSEEAFNVLGQKLNLKANEAGAYTVQGLVDGIVNAQEAAVEAGNDLGVNLVDGVKEGAGTHSPSTKTKEVGYWTDMGLVDGLLLGQNNVKTQAGLIGGSVIYSIDTALDSTTIKEMGANVSRGLATGIRAGKSAVIMAATEVAVAAISAAKSKLEINSPSHVFERLGAGTIEGYVKGIDENAKAAQQSVSDALQFDISRQAVNAAGMNMSLQQQNTRVDYSGMYSTVYNAIAAAMNESNPNTDLIKVMGDMARRPIQTTMYVNGRNFAEATASDMTAAQEKNTKIRNMIRGARA